MVRSFHVFPAIGRDEAQRRLQVARVETVLPIGVSDAGATRLVWAELFDELGHADFDSADQSQIAGAAGFDPAYGIEVAISGHFPDWRLRDLRTLVLWLLSDGGCASYIGSDDFKTLDEWKARWHADRN